jgi:hypothetical protein
MATICTVVHSWYETRTSKPPCYLCLHLIPRRWIGCWPWCTISIPMSKCSKWQGIWGQQKVLPWIWNCISLPFEQRMPVDTMCWWPMKSLH